MSEQTLLVTLSGRDRPGVTAELFAALGGTGCTVLDVEQVVIRGRLVLGVLLELAGAEATDDVSSRAVTERVHAVGTRSG